MHSQTLLVLNLLRVKPITRFHAHTNHILNITARITDLRNAGYEIYCEMVTDPNHHNGKTKFGRWTLISEPT